MFAMSGGTFVVPEFNANLALVCHQRYAPSTSQPGQSPGKLTLMEELELCLGDKNAQADVSRLIVYCQFTAGILSAITAPILGSLSDRIGRKPILALSTTGILLYNAVMLLILRYPDAIDVRWILVGYAIEGLGGTYITAIAASQAYITDLSSPRERATLFSYIQACTSLAQAAGPLIAGILIASINSFEGIYWISFASYLLLTLLFLFVLPESRWARSVTGDRGINLDTTLRENPLQQVYSSCKSLWETSANRRANLAILAVIEQFVFAVMTCLPPLQMAYSSYLFHWHPTTQSFYMALVNTWSILVLVVLFPVIMTIVRRHIRRKRNRTHSTVFNTGELGAIRTSLILQILGYAGVAVTRSPAWFIFSSLIFACGNPVTPLLTSSLTAHVPSEHSGQLLGMLSFLHAIGRITIPTALNATYSVTIGVFPQALFVVLAGSVSGLFLASLCVKHHGLGSSR
jgi:MFS family permease